MPLKEIMSKILYCYLPVIAIFIMGSIDLFSGSIYLIVGFLLTLPYLIKNTGVIVENKILRTFIILVLIGSVLNFITTQNGVGGIINFITAIGLAHFCCTYKRITSIVILAMCIRLMVFLYTQMFIQMINPALIFDEIGLSKNTPGFLLVLFCIYWGYMKKTCGYSLPLILPLIAVVLCFILDGRSSLGVTIGIALIGIMLRGRNHKVIVFSIGLAVILYSIQYLSEYYAMTNLSESGMETSRYRIWNSYLSALDVPSFLFGLDTLNVPILKQYDGNPHNAFFNYHYRFGILGLLALLYLIKKSCDILIKNKEYILLLLVMLLMVRLFFDACLGSTTDFVTFAILFYPLIKESALRESKNEKKTINKITNKIVDII